MLRGVCRDNPLIFLHPPPPPPQAQHADDRVPQMVRALGISPQQRTQLSQLRRLFLQKLAKIVGDRKDVNAQLLVRAAPLALFVVRYFCTSKT